MTLDTWKFPGSVSVQAFAPGAPVQPGVPFCFGDGSGTACPCGNASAVGAEEGCLNSLSIGGKLVSSGVPSVANDTLNFTGAQMTNSSCLYFQGTLPTLGGLGAMFGDGLRCAGGNIRRLGLRFASGGSVSLGGSGAPSLVQIGNITSAGVRQYQAWYRNAAAFCTASTFNLTNGVEVLWVP